MCTCSVIELLNESHLQLWWCARVCLVVVARVHGRAQAVVAARTCQHPFVRLDARELLRLLAGHGACACVNLTRGDTRAGGRAHTVGCVLALQHDHRGRRTVMMLAVVHVSVLELNGDAALMLPNRFFVFVSEFSLV